jgi:hypothetical protein
VRPIALTLCLWVVIFGFLARAQNSTPAETPPLQLAIELSDGSRIIGTPAIDRLKIATDYSELEIKLGLVRKIDFRGTSGLVHVDLQNGDMLNGRPAATEVVMKTIFGQVTIPLIQVRDIQVRSNVAKTLPDGLVLHYTFDVDAGERVADKSDCGNDGRLQGATYTKDGKVGGALSFSGDHQMIALKDSASLRIQNFTIMAWIKRGDLDRTSKTDEDGEIFGCGRFGYILGIRRSGVMFLSRVDNSEVRSSFEIHDQDFHHVAVTKQGSKVVFYLDGVAYPANDYNPGFEFSGDAAVGAVPGKLTCWFLGIIDELAVFNRPLSGEEIKGVYDAQK